MVQHLGLQGERREDQLLPEGGQVYTVQLYSFTVVQEYKNMYRIPGLFLNNEGHLGFRNYVNGTANYKYNHKIDRMRWYRVQIEQVPYSGKARILN